MLVTYAPTPAKTFCEAHDCDSFPFLKIKLVKYKNVGLLRTAYQPVGPVVKCKIVVSGLTFRS